MELMIAVVAFSLFVTTYFANVYAMQTQETSSFTYYAEYLNESVALQGAVYALDLKNLSISTADSLLNATIRRGILVKRLFPLGASPECQGCMTRILIENGSAYYLTVHYNETPN